MKLAVLLSSGRKRAALEVQLEETGFQAAVLEQLIQAQELVAELPIGRTERTLKQTEQIFNLACEARDRFLKGDCRIKKEILIAVASNLILKDKILRIEATEPFQIIKSSVDRCSDENGAFEPEKTFGPSGRNGQFPSHRPKMCAC